MLRLMPLLVLALQQRQAKQLALISAGIGKMLKGQQKFEERVAKELSGKQIKGEGEALGHVATYSNHPANGAPQKLSKSVTRNSNQFSDQSLSKVDFWAEPVDFSDLVFFLPQPLSCPCCSGAAQAKKYIWSTSLLGFGLFPPAAAVPLRLLLPKRSKTTNSKPCCCCCCYRRQENLVESSELWYLSFYFS